MEIRNAVDRDAPALIEMAREFVAESGHGWEFDPLVTMSTFMTRIRFERSDVICVIENDEIAAAAMVAWDRDFVVETLGFIEKFYVLRRYRGTRAGRLLVEGCVDWFEAHHVRAAFTTATAALSRGQDRQFVNLFAKYGFEPCGDTLARLFDHG